MKRMTVFVLSVFFVLGLGVAAYAIHEIIPSETQIVMPGPNAEKAQ